MLVKDFMTPVVITVREDQSMLEARETMRGKNLNSLPVVDDLKRVRGIITAEDIGKASPSDASTLRPLLLITCCFSKKTSHHFPVQLSKIKQAFRLQPD